ncbi:hypothetical protein ACFWA5_06445 [Streptomyces mirabilis]|uniref:hypothetical protein n=1 Tax=Streptomyces mirabilis TaxID=68239 RepID=UPI00364E0D6E
MPRRGAVEETASFDSGEEPPPEERDSAARVHATGELMLEVAPARLSNTGRADVGQEPGTGRQSA